MRWPGPILTRIVLTAALVLATAACFEVEFRIDIDSDGSGDATLEMVIPPGTLSLAEISEQIGKKLETDGWEVQIKERPTSDVIVTATRRFTELNQLEGAMGLKGNLVSERLGPFKRGYTLQLAYDGDGLLESLVGRIKMPGTVRDTNVSLQSGSVMQWNLTGVTHAELEARSVEWNLQSPLAMSREATRAIEASLLDSHIAPRTVRIENERAVVRPLAPGAEPTVLWPERARSLSTTPNGLVAITVASEDPLRNEIVVVSCSRPGKPIIHIGGSGYDAAIDSTGTYIAYLEALEPYTEEEIDAALGDVLRAQGILYRTTPSDPESAARAAQIASQAADQLRAAENFAAVARTLRGSSSESVDFFPRGPANAGDAGDLDLGTLSAGKREILTRIETAKQGDVLGPFRSELGYHIMKFVGRGRQLLGDEIPVKRSRLHVLGIDDGSERTIELRDARSVMPAGAAGFRVFTMSFPFDYRIQYETGDPNADDQYIQTEPVEAPLRSTYDPRYLLADQSSLQRTGDHGNMLRWWPAPDRSPRLLTADSRSCNQWLTALALSEDGSKVAMVLGESGSHREGTGRYHKNLLQLWYPGTQEFRNVVETSADVPNHLPYRIGDIAWRPGCQEIVFEQTYTGSHETELWSVNVDGSERRKLTTGRFPVWFAPNAQLLFTRGTWNEAQTWSIALDEPEQSDPECVLEGAPGNLVFTSSLSPLLLTVLPVLVVGVAWIIAVALPLGGILIIRRFLRSRKHLSGSGS